MTTIIISPIHGWSCVEANINRLGVDRLKMRKYISHVPSGDATYAHNLNWLIRALRLKD